MKIPAEIDFSLGEDGGERMYLETARDIFAKLYRNPWCYNHTIPSARGTVDGIHEPDRAGHWTDGFWPGMLLLGNTWSGDPGLMELFRKYDNFFAERIQNDPEINRHKGYLDLDHDVGFIFHLTHVFHYMLTGNANGREIGLRAAKVLMDRFNTKGKFIRAWNDWDWDTPEFREEKKGKVIIDSMMNVPLLFWAAVETGDQEYYETAVQHINTVLKYMVRPSGSTYHTYNFDPASGEPRGGKTGQGYADESCWSRGQSWALYGFGLAYRYTQDNRYLAAAIQCADYWQGSLLPNGDAPWDFDAPRNEHLPIDTSAMAVAACGLLELASHLSHDPERQAACKNNAEAMVRRLIRAHPASPAPRSNALLLRGCSGPAYQKGSEEEKDLIYRFANQSLIFGDYYFLEAIVRLDTKECQLPYIF
jgi:unsaturated chondroitin disaccharide hydrolase